MYLIDFDIQVQRLTPPQNRKPAFLAWLRALVAPLNSLNADFFGTYFPDVTTRAKRTGQKIVLENTLNQVFNPSLSPPIYINNTGDDIETIYLYNEGEGYPALYLYNELESLPYYMYNDSEYSPEFNFIVYIPSAVLGSYNVNQIIAEVNKYKPVGRTFTTIEY